MIRKTGCRKHPRARAFFLLSAFWMICPLAYAAPSVEQDVVAKLDQIRAIRVQTDPKALDIANRRMDDAWKFFTANKSRALPVIREQIAQELKHKQPNDLLLLDAGRFLYSNDGAAGKAIAVQALLALNPSSEIVRANYQELFNFAFSLSRDHDPRVLPFIGKAFLGSDDKIYIPQHALTLDGTLVCAFLYGAYGPDSETYLRTQLVNKRLARRVVEVLIWIGSPASVSDIKAAFAASPDDEMFARVTAFMMQAGGPAGRAYMLSVDPKTLRPASRDYLAKVRGAVEASTFKSIRAGFVGIPGDAHLSDPEVKIRLAAMIRNDGKDNRTSPLAILDSKLPAEFLIAQLAQVRAHSFRRMSDEALDDVQVTNALLNALYYRR